MDLESTHIHHVPSILGTKRARTEQGLKLAECTHEQATLGLVFGVLSPHWDYTYKTTCWAKDNPVGGQFGA